MSVTILFLTFVIAFDTDMTEIDYNDDLKAALDAVRRGGVILYPTDTVWGLGCDATNEAAVARVYHIKRRADNKALITLVDSIAALERAVSYAPDVALDMATLSDRPLTIVYDRPQGLAPNLLGPDGSAGIRITRERFSADLCRRLRRPLVSTSANVSGAPAPASFAEISPEIVGAVDYAVAYRRDDTAAARPSAVIKIGNDSSVKIIRQ